MTVFQHTLPMVLAQTKTQTSRLWKPDYVFAWSDYEEPNQTVLSQKAWDAHKIRRLYYVGQILSVQPSRGSKGVAKIRVLELAKRDVRDFTDEDIRREGFQHRHEFFETWIKMHDKPLWKWSEKFPELGFMSELRDNGEWSIKRKAEDYTALVIRFELVTEQKAAA